MIEIQDMYLAALLLAYGFDYRGVDKSDQKRQRFLFNDGRKFVWTIYGDDLDPKTESYNIDNVIAGYIAQEVLFPANYPEALKRIKYVIHSEERNDDQERKWGSGNKVYASRSEVNPIG